MVGVLVGLAGNTLSRILPPAWNCGCANKFENFQHGFRVVVYAETATEIDRTSGKPSGKPSGKILAYIRENPDITIPELSLLLEITERSAERNISQLQKDKKLLRIGAAKGGYWEVIGD